MTMKSAYTYNQLFVRCLYEFAIFSYGLTEEINRRCVYILREHSQPLLNCLVLSLYIFFVYHLC